MYCENMNIYRCNSFLGKSSLPGQYVNLANPGCRSVSDVREIMISHILKFSLFRTIKDTIYLKVCFSHRNGIWEACFIFASMLQWCVRWRSIWRIRAWRAWRLPGRWPCGGLSEEAGMAGLASVWAMARRKSKEYRRKVDAAMGCSNVCSHTYMNWT